MTADSPDALAAFRHPGVARFAFGRLLSAMGSTGISVAVGWQLYESTGSPLALGLVGLVEVIPVVLLVLPAGVAADRFRRRDVAIAAHLVLGACAAGLAALTAAHAPGWTYYPLLFLTGVGMAFRGPAVGAMLPLLVPKRDFANANAWLSSTYELASMAGPAVGGGLIALGGDATLALAVGAALHLGFVGVLASLPAHPPASSAARPVGWEDLLAGARFIFGTPMFLAAITLDLFAVLLGGATALLPIFARDILEVGPVGLGWLRAAPALGALSMALLQTRLRPWRRPGRALLLAVVGFGLATVGFGLSTSFPLSFAMLFLTGLCDNVSVVVRATLEQSLTPDSMRGRVSAVNYVFIGMSNELGTFESGLAASLLGAVGAVVLGGVGTLVVVAAVAWRWPALWRLPPLSTLRPP